ncbi:MAG: hypothetical protein HY075_15195 [Deltaproteobacteria bacterium]|nr:hypothetical protein [Deltaproteobacteria bacterium]
MKRKSAKDVQISQHDLSQIELKTLYRVAEDIQGKDSVSYTQEVFFFIPRSMEINKDTYTKEQFYLSMTNYIRLKTPKVLEDDELGNQRIDLIMPQLTSALADASVLDGMLEPLLLETRVFGSYINDRIKSLSRDKPDAIPKALGEIHSLIERYRAVMDELHEKISVHHHLVDSFKYVDEFVSHKLEEYLVGLTRHGIDCAFYMKKEHARRKAMGYMEVLDVADESEREDFMYRMGLFKKYISEVLYLEVKRYKREKFFTNIAAIFGAMSAAVVTALLDPNARTSMSAGFFAGLRDSLPLVIAFVAVFYATKDRLKEEFKQRVFAWLKRWIPDYNFEIYSKKGELIGACTEVVAFVNSRKVPPDIRKLRLKGRHVSLRSVSLDQGLHYKRTIRVKHDALKGAFKNAKHLKDILRFNFSNFHLKLGDAERPQSFIGHDSKIREIVMPKVYHIRMIVRHQISGAHGTRTTYEQVRVILDKKGIKRIEERPAERDEKASSAEAA